jgi:diaminopimelate epimerase
MSTPFVKMHGLGNDFMVFDTIRHPVHFSPELIKQWSNRNTGIGFDQCLIIEKSNDLEIDFYYRIFNRDGTEVGQCGNGARCIARYINHYGLSKKTTLTIATKTSVMHLKLNSDQSVTVNLGLPRLNPQEIPLLADQLHAPYSLSGLSSETYYFYAVNVGNPHAVIIVENLAQYDVQYVGSYLSVHPFFPEQVNVGFLEKVSSSQIKLRVYERGCGETLACGSGAVAAAAIGRLYLGLNQRVEVFLPGGELFIEWEKQSSPILLTGPAKFVYEGLLS